MNATIKNTLNIANAIRDMLNELAQEGRIDDARYDELYAPAAEFFDWFRAHRPGSFQGALPNEWEQFAAGWTESATERFNEILNMFPVEEHEELIRLANWY